MQSQELKSGRIRSISEVAELLFLILQSLTLGMLIQTFTNSLSRVMLGFIELRDCCIDFSL